MPACTLYLPSNASYNLQPGCLPTKCLHQPNNYGVGVRWRAALLLPVLQFWGRVLLCLGFFMVPQVRGREHLKEAEGIRALMVFNHVSYLDGLLICSLFSPSGLAKVG